jgi:hypothetical protein
LFIIYLVGIVYSVGVGGTGESDYGLTTVSLQCLASGNQRILVAATGTTSTGLEGAMDTLFWRRISHYIRYFRLCRHGDRTSIAGCTNHRNRQ